MVGKEQVVVAAGSIKQASSQNVDGIEQAKVSTKNLHEPGQKLNGQVVGRAV